MAVPNDPAANGGDFMDALLVQLGLPVTNANKTFLHEWAQAEGGYTAGAAKNNPLNTTMRGYGATVKSNNISEFPTQDMGVAATAATLKSPQYAPILSALRVSDSKTAAEAVVKSPWGTLPHPLLDLVGDSKGDAKGENLINSTADVALGAGEAAAKAVPTFGIADLIKAVGRITGKLLDPKWWLRIGQGLAAAALLLIALGLIFRKQIVRGATAVATDGMSEAA